MIISPSKRFIFVHLHKCAGTSLTAALDRQLTWNDIQLGGTPLGEAMNEPYADRFRLSKHSTAQQIRDVVGPQIWESYFTFSIVRHPYDRLLSVYRFAERMVRRVGRRDRLRWALGSRAPRFTQWAAVQAYLASSSFSEFLRREELAKDPSCATQFSCLADETQQRLMVDFVGKVETLDRDLEVLAARLNLSSLDVGHHNESGGACRLDDYYTPNDYSFVFDRYRIDFEQFGYTAAPAARGEQRPVHVD